MANRKGKIKLKNGDVLYPETSWDKVTGRPSSLPADGGNSETVNNHTVNSDVPANAKFTDTTYSAGTGISINSSNAISNSGVRSVTQDASDGHKLTINTGGTNTTITIPDNNTQYSAGSGLSLSGTTFNHSNSVTAVTAAGLYKVKYDAQGHITGTTAVAKKDITDLGIPSSDTNTTYTIATGDSNGQIKVTPSSGSAYNVSVKGLGSAAYTNSTAYASSSHNHDSAYLKLTGGTLSGDLNVDKQNINGIHKASFFMSDGADSSNIMSLRAPSGSKVLELDYIDSSGNVVSFGNIATVNDIPTSYSWDSITGKPTTFTPSSHTHTKSQITDFPSSMPASDVYAWAKAASKPSYYFSEIGAGIIYNAVIDTHPESSTSIIAYYASDLVNLVQRGGSITAVNKTTGATYNLSSALDGTPSYASFNVSAVTDVVEIVIVSPTTYSWNTRFGIGFGSSNWRAKNVKIETGNSSGAWKTIYNVTNSGYPIHDVRESGPAVSGGSNPWDRIRITLTNFNNTSPRIAGIWTMNYGSIGLANNFMQKSGGTMWGSIIPGKNNGYDFGDATHVWNNAYIKTIYENGTALSSKYLGINAKASSASNADTVNGLTVQTAVPANAKFTDTTYSAVSKTAAGLCPALPNESTTTKYLRQDGTWQVPPNTTYSNATTSAAGLMSSADKTKLDGLATVATSGKYSDLSGKPTIPAADDHKVLVGDASKNTMYKLAYLEGDASGNVYLYKELSSGLYVLTDPSDASSYEGLTLCCKGTIEASAINIDGSAVATHDWVTDRGYITGITKSMVTSALGYTPPTTDTNTWKANSSSSEGYVASGAGKANKVWKTDANGNPAWRDDANTTYSNATTSAAGLMSSTDKTKLDGIASGANNYTHPASHPASMITDLATVATSGSYNDLSNKPTIPTVPGYGTSAAKIGTSSAGSATTVSRSDHVHAIDLATGDSNGQVKIAGTNVSVKGLGSAAYTASTAYASSSHTHTKSQITDFPGSVSKTAAGLCPALPNETATTKYLRQDGTWQVPPNTTYSVATTSANGLMSSSDKTKLDGIASGANNYSLPTATASVLGGVKSSTTGTTSGKDYNVQVNADGTMKVNVPWTDSNTWKANSSSSEGYVSSGSGQANKVWKTDANGNPAWRDDANSWRGIQNNLTSDSTTDSLSAAQGKALKGMVDSKLSLSGGDMTGNLSLGKNDIQYIHKAEFCMSDGADSSNSMVLRAPSTSKVLELCYKDSTGTLSSFGNVATSDDISDMATKSWVTSQGYKTTDTNTWKANSSSSEGYVSSGSGQANKVWKTDANGNPAWRDDANTTYSAATTSADGLMSSSDKTKLNGIASGANNYTHPASHPATMITGLANVATSGSYNDLSDKPTIPSAANNGKITINQGGTKKGEFTVNQSGNTTIDLDAGGGGGNVNTTERGTVDLWLVGVQNSAANNQPVKTVCNRDPSDPSDLRDGVCWSNYSNRLEIYGDLYVSDYVHVGYAVNAQNIDPHAAKLSGSSERFYVHPSADTTATGYKGRTLANYLYEVVPGGIGYFNITYCSSSTASPTSVSAQLAYVRPTMTSTTSTSIFCRITYLSTAMAWTTINCYVGNNKNNTYISGPAKVRMKTNTY